MCDVAAAGQGVGLFAAGNATAAVGRFAGYAHQAQRFAGDADLLLFQVFEATGKAGEGGLCGWVGSDHACTAGSLQRVDDARARGRVDGDESAAGILLPKIVSDRQGHLAAAALDAAMRIEANLQQAESLGVFPGLADTDGVAVAVADDRRVGAGRSVDSDRRKIAEQGMRVATDDHVHVTELRGHCHIGCVALVGKQNDVADALRAQSFDVFLRTGDLVCEARAR
ncbi:MAG: hypothetical protein CAPSK01_004594 [Candidatus Accumulibacter vicinus]|uniref:Uncharacterized protein n=1 Tax=Candidatus Accumulibacter vicinus TaxID=2954382 RepID=A0A084XUF5_9PROT|nr:MAG: hypothetical protein CAPSK01_004594 [Candidatus Accumulibacter vicinus]